MSPPGVINIITVDNESASILTSHPEIKKIAFTGSTATGKAIMASASQSIKRVTLELGGNDAAIVLEDADLDLHIPKIFWGAFANNAQFCVAIKRLYVHEKIREEFLRKFTEFGRGVVVGNGLHPGVGIGPIQNAAQYQKVQGMLASARKRGLSLIELTKSVPENGYFIPVTLVLNPPENDETVTEEAFGPILPILFFDNIEDVIDRANNSNYGLGSSIWTKDTKRARDMAQHLETGITWINTIHVIRPDIPFSGHKQSGLGLENSKESLLEYTNIKSVVTVD